VFGSNSTFFKPDIEGINFWIVSYPHTISSLEIVNVNSNYNMGGSDSFKNLFFNTTSIMCLFFSVFAQSDWLFGTHKNILPSRSDEVNIFISASSPINQRLIDAAQAGPTTSSGPVASDSRTTSSLVEGEERRLRQRLQGLWQVIRQRYNELVQDMTKKSDGGRGPRLPTDHSSSPVEVEGKKQRYSQRLFLGGDYFSFS
jgi:hypothetical protein